MIKKKGLILNKCEIEGCVENKNLHLHHIVERTEINTTNHNYNLAILCPNHHAAHHHGNLKIIAIYPATLPPNNRVLVYELDGIKNIDIDEPYVKFENKSYKV